MTQELQAGRELQIHPLVEGIFPPMSADEFAELVSDIRAHGVHEPISMHEGKILDGQHRYRACRELKIPIPCRDWDGSGSLISFVISENLKRRHLSESQKAFIGLYAEEKFAEEARWRKFAALKQNAAADHTVPAQMRERRKQKNKHEGEAATRAAKTTGVSPRYIQYAKHIQKVAPELAKKIVAGEMTITQAQRGITTSSLGASEEVEWYTPGKYVEAAREVLGGIDLDPASCEAANNVVKAKKFFSLNDDGLKQEWHGRIFMNPPFGREGTPSFVPKLIEQYKAGNIKAAILVCAARLETQWFHPLFDYVLCFPDHRIKFWGQPGPDSAPPFSPAFAYLGPNEQTFAAVFSQFGAVVRRVKVNS